VKGNQLFGWQRKKKTELTITFSGVFLVNELCFLLLGSYFTSQKQGIGHQHLRSCWPLLPLSPWKASSPMSNIQSFRWIHIKAPPS
jgi:hypothetical protein